MKTAMKEVFVINPKLGALKVMDALIRQGIDPYIISDNFEGGGKSTAHTTVLALGALNVVHIAASLHDTQAVPMSSSHVDRTIDVFIDNEVVTVCLPPSGVTTIEDFFATRILNVDAQAYSHRLSDMVYGKTADPTTLSFIPNTYSLRKNPEEVVHNIMRAVNSSGIFVSQEVEDYLKKADVNSSFITKELKNIFAESYDIIYSLTILSLIPHSSQVYTLGDETCSSDFLDTIRSEAWNKAISHVLVVNYLESQGTIFYTYDFLSGKEKSYLADFSYTKLSDRAATSSMRRILFKHEMPQFFVDDFASLLGIEAPKPTWKGRPDPYIVTGDKLISLGFSPNKHFKTVISFFHTAQDYGVDMTDDFIVKVCADILNNLR